MNVRFTILLVVVLILVGGAVGITNCLSQKAREPQQDWLYKIDVDDIGAISIKHQDTEDGLTEAGFECVPEPDSPKRCSHWVIKDGFDTPVGESWPGKTLLVSGPRSSRLLAETIDDPGKYGLDSPRAEVRVVNKNGFPIDFHLGDLTPDGENWYARLVGSERLYTVAAIWGDEVARMATEPPYDQLFQLEPWEMTDISVTHQEQQLEYVYRESEEDEEYRWIIRVNSGDAGTPVSEAWADRLKDFSLPVPSQVIMEDIDDPNNYGLESPDTTLRIDNLTGFTVVIHLGDPTPDGVNRYARLVDKTKLYTVSGTWADQVPKLVTDPPYPTPPDASPPADGDTAKADPREG